MPEAPKGAQRSTGSQRETIARYRLDLKPEEIPILPSAVERFKQRN